MNRHRVFAIARRLLQQFRRDRRTLALLFVAPLVILGLLDLLLRGGGAHPAMGVVVEDRGPLGAAIAQRLEAWTRVDATGLDLAGARARLGRGELAGYVVLPADFSEAALSRHLVAPELHLEGSQPALSQAVAVATQQATLGAVAAAAGDQAPRLTIRTEYLHGGSGLDALDYLGAALIGLIVFFLVFVITCVAFLRERSQGTLERLMASPLRRPELVAGYMLGFTVLALVQAAAVLAFCLYGLRAHNSGNILLIFGLEVLMALAAVNLGIFLSMFARTEFQAVQFIPLVIVPQLLLSDILFPVSTEPAVLSALSRALPLTYAVDGLREVMLKGADLSSATVRLDSAAVLAFCLLMVAAAAASLRRRVV